LNGKGRRVAICGPGPSLRGASIAVADEVWGCNTGLDYLVDHGLRVTHGIVLDADERMVTLLPRTFDVTYRIASSVCPNYPARLQAEGRAFEFFHSYLGTSDPDGWDRKARGGQSYERHLYATHYPPGPETGYGVNCGTRAVCLALIMGFDHIDVYGMDGACAPDAGPMPECTDPRYADWLDTLTLYADGRSPRSDGDEPVMLEGVIDERRWHTTVDMALATVCLVEMQRAFPGRITVHGDTLFNAIKDKDAAFFAEMPHFVESGEYGQVAGINAYPSFSYSAT
jgi:hypothetical protein